MTKAIHRFARRAGVVLSAGVLFQATGCGVDTAALLSQLTASVVQNVVTSFVFSSFNLIP